jgi:hypothetical protein
MGQKKSVQRNLERKPQDRRPLGRIWSKWEDSSGSRNKETSSDEYGNNVSDSKICRKCFD